MHGPAVGTSSHWKRLLELRWIVRFLFLYGLFGEAGFAYAVGLRKSNSCHSLLVHLHVYNQHYHHALIHSQRRELMLFGKFQVIIANHETGHPSFYGVLEVRHG